MSPIANPILRGMYPDPSVCRVDGNYYLVNSTFEYLPGIPIHRSTDLETWELVGHAVNDRFDFAGVGDSRGMFAPTIRYNDGLFYIACTFVDVGNFYVTATDPAGPWSDPVYLPDARGIDPSLFFHDWRAWWVGCREVDDPTFDGETEIWLRELDLARGELVGPETVIWTRTQYRAVWAEGPHLYRQNGWFYLITAEGGTGFEHSVMVARSESLAGPYLPCPRNPVLTHRHLGTGVAVQNVGHADLFEGDNDEWWMVVLATRPIDGHHVLGRETHLARVVWEDGWPVVNAGLGQLDPPFEVAGHWGSGGVPRIDDFLSVRGSATFASPADGGILLEGSPRSSLLRRLSSTSCTVSVTLDALAPGAVAGLVLRQRDNFSARIEIEADAATLVSRVGPETHRRATVAVSPGAVTLSATVSHDGVTWSVGAEVLGQTPLSELSSETAGGFVGTTFGPFVATGTALFTAWTQENAAPAALNTA
jgi:alpha-N-arabinofuranosidase